MRKKQWILLLVVLAAFVAATAGMKGYQKNQDQKAAEGRGGESLCIAVFFR